MIKKIFKNLIISLLLFFLVLILLFPIYYLLIFSFLTKEEFLNNKIPLFKFNPNLSNYYEIFDGNFKNAFLLTILTALVMIIFRSIVSIAATVVLINLNFKLKQIFLFLILLISVIPEFSLYLGLKNTLLKLNLINSNFFPISLTTNSIFSYFLLKYLFKTADKVKSEKYKLMINDNLSWYDKFRLVYFNELKMAYFLIIIFSVINVWNDFLWPNFLLRGFKEQNITLWFKNLGQTSLGNTFINIQAAGAFFSLSIPYAFYLIFSNFINKQLSK
ncbi:ABC transporter permease family protein [[Mycoplasma] collis]|uniref:carbohydrate ABC transporter permease n=1 Tax=[Mycoplasma] collis TaxID=2127 RepID=UPI00051BE2CC|nr:carbohydrate ABC transporter permease [[Mycoplasma] collis]